MIYIANCAFESVTSSGFYGIINDDGNYELLIEYTKFFDICSVCAGAIYKTKGKLSLKKTNFDFCSATKSGNNEGGSILYGYQFTLNFSMCYASHSSPKSPEQSIDSPLFLQYATNEAISTSNFSNNNGNSYAGNVFMETWYNQGSITEFSNFINGSARRFVYYYECKKNSYIRNCNILDNKVIVFVETGSIVVSITGCALFNNSNVTPSTTVLFDGCISDNPYFCSEVSTYTHIINNAVNEDCYLNNKKGETNSQKKKYWSAVISCAFVMYNLNPSTYKNI